MYVVGISRAYETSSDPGALEPATTSDLSETSLEIEVWRK